MWRWGLLSGCAKVLLVMQGGCGHLNSVVPDSPYKRFNTLAHPTEHNLLGPRSGLAPGSALGLFWVLSIRLEDVILPNGQNPMWSSSYGYLCSECKCLVPLAHCPASEMSWGRALHTFSGRFSVAAVYSKYSIAQYELVVIKRSANCNQTLARY